MTRVVAVVQARCGSERLPSKVMVPLAGRPVIRHVLTAARNADLVDEVILATTQSREDDRLSELAGSLKFSCFRGSGSDVLGRFIGALNRVQADAVVRLTGDDPLLDPAVIDTVVRRFLEEGCDYVSNIISRSWPRGLDTEVITRSALERCHREGHRQEDREHVTFYARTHPDLFVLRNVVAPDRETWPELRLCIDTEEDQALLEKIFAGLFQPGRALRVGEVIDWLKQHPELAEINQDVRQKRTLGKVY